MKIKNYKIDEIAKLKLSNEEDGFSDNSTRLKRLSKYLQLYSKMKFVTLQKKESITINLDTLKEWMKIVVRFAEVPDISMIVPEFYIKVEQIEQNLDLIERDLKKISRQRTWERIKSINKNLFNLNQQADTLQRTLSFKFWNALNDSLELYKQTSDKSKKVIPNSPPLIQSSSLESYESSFENSIDSAESIEEETKLIKSSDEPDRVKDNDPKKEDTTDETSLEVNNRFILFSSKGKHQFNTKIKIDNIWIILFIILVVNIILMVTQLLSISKF